MRIGSSPFMAILGLTAILAALAGYVMVSPPLLWSAAIVAVYALHLLAVSRARRESIPAAQSLESERRSLTEQRDRLAELERELERKLGQAEEQWKLLRGMVQDRLNQSATKGRPPESAEELPTKEAGGHMNAVASSAASAGIPKQVRRLDPDDSRPGYGRW